MIIEKEHPLDNCQVFVQLRKCFHDYGQKAKSLKSLVYWSGNDEHIAQICDQVAAILMEHELIRQEPHAKRPEELVTGPNGPVAMNHLRGLLIYLVLNTSNEAEPQWSSQVIHLCHQLPAIPQFLTIAIALRCGLQQPLEEFLACGPRWLTTQYFEAFNETLSHIHPDLLDALPLVFGALKAAGRAIIHHNLPEENKRLLRQMASMLQRHLLDSNERLKTLPRAATRRIYLAEVMQRLLEVLLETLSNPKGRQKPNCFSIYSQMSADISGSYSNDPMTDLRLYALILLDALQRILQLISVDTFMYWLEIPSKRLLYSYQELICSQTAELLKLVEQDEELRQHSVCKQMQSFAEAAKSFEDRLAELTLGELLTFLDGDLGDVSSEQLLAGLDNLFGRSIAFGNDECVETMGKHLQLLTTKHSGLILVFLSQVVEAKMEIQDEGISITEVKQEKDDDDDENEQPMSVSGDEEEEEEYGSLLNLVLRPLFQQLSVTDKIQVLQTRDELNVTDGFKFEAPDHQERRIRFFNRLDTNKKFPLDEFLGLCYENAKQTWLDFARLAVTHQRFMLLFWRLACHACPKHAAYNISGCAREILLDEQLLLKPNALRFLSSLYGHRQILNGLHMESSVLCVGLKDGACPYEKETLKQAQCNFLEACAAGLAKFSEPLNYSSLQLILRLLLGITVAEKQINVQGIKQLRKIKKEQAKPEGGDDAPLVKEAMRYIDMHAFLPEWRQENWPLISQIMVTIDALRWDLTTFEQVRVDTLGLAVRYWGRGLSHLKILGEEFRQRIFNLAGNLRHKDFWVVNLEEASSNYSRRLIRLLTQASGSEATILFAKVLMNRTDSSVMEELSDAVEQAKCEPALQAFKFLFRSYLIAYRKHVRFIKPSRKRHHWDHLMTVVAKAPSSIRSEVLEEAHQGFAARLRITPNEQDKQKSEEVL
ncbi:gem-associated protein 4b [Drosophila suzukii]|uniref:Gem-associated protein 4b n=1 Tax=Drosophila suzukii TaxID=28584 RepID=A0AB39Z9I0_DROSZ